MADPGQEAFTRAIQAKFEKKMREHEIEQLEFWKGHLDRLAAMKPEGVGALQLQIRKVAEMMANRIRTIKRESS
jgi:hypothetical protein